MADFNWGSFLGKAQQARGTSGQANPEFMNKLLVAKERNDPSSIGSLLSNKAYNSPVYAQGGQSVNNLRNKGYMNPGDYKDVDFGSAWGGDKGGDNAGPAGPNRDTSFNGQSDYNAYTRFGAADDMMKAPEGFDIGSLLAKQAQTYKQQLDAGKARGQYSPNAYAAGMSDLDRQMSAARPMAEDIMRGTLGEERGRFNEIMKEAQTTHDLDKGNFKFAPYRQQADELMGSFNNSIGDRLTSAIGGTNFFKMPDIKTAMGSAAGAGNMADPALLKAMTEQRARLGTTRGLGNQGGL
jgi:hypothetical protein